MRNKLAAAALATLGALAGCGGGSGGGQETTTKASDTALDIGQVKQQIVSTQRDASPKLDVGAATCPADPDVSDGAKFSCTVDVQGVTVPYAVTVIGATGQTAGFRTTTDRNVIATSALERELRKPLSDRATADCGDAPVLAFGVGTRIDCRVANGGPRRPVAVRMTKLDGSFVLELTSQKPRSLPDRSVTYVAPPGVEIGPFQRGQGPGPRAGVRLSLAYGNNIDISHTHRAGTTPLTNRKALSAFAVTVGDVLRQGGVTHLSRASPTSLDRIPGVVIRGELRDGTPPITAQQEFVVVAQGHDVFYFSCQSHGDRAAELRADCRQVGRSLRLRPSGR